MKDACTLLVAAFLFLAPGTGRSQDGGMSPRPLVPGAPGSTFEAVPPAAAGTLPPHRRMPEWDKLRTVGHLGAEPTEPAPLPVPEPVPPPPAAQAVSPAAGASCMAGPRHRCCWEQLDDWLTYRPLGYDCCTCFPRCAPCCPPPLYAFFMGSCCIPPTGAGCRPPCGPNGACGNGHGFAGLWQGMRFWCFRPGHERFHLWTPSRGLLFWRDES